jgi:hypothetical protein
MSVALGSGASVLVPTSQRQAAVRAAWAGQQRAAGKSLWSTPAVFTFSQFAEKRLLEQWAGANQPDALLPMGAEWALLRELRGSGSVAEARALLAAVRLLHEWRIPRSSSGAVRIARGRSAAGCARTAGDPITQARPQASARLAG